MTLEEHERFKDIKLFTKAERDALRQRVVAGESIEPATTLALLDMLDFAACYEQALLAGWEKTEQRLSSATQPPTGLRDVRSRPRRSRG